MTGALENTSCRRDGDRFVVRTLVIHICGVIDPPTSARTLHPSEVRVTLAVITCGKDVVSIAVETKLTAWCTVV